MFDTRYTENQYAFQLFDFAAERGTLKHGTVYFHACRKELIKLVTDQVNSANFWHDRWLEMCKEVMCVAGLPDDFVNHGTGEAFDILREATLPLRQDK